MPEFDACCDPAELLDLSGRKGLVVGIANDRSLAWPAALHFRQAGADLAITYVDERTKPFTTLSAEMQANLYARKPEMLLDQACLAFNHGEHERFFANKI